MIQQSSSLVFIQELKTYIHKNLHMDMYSSFIWLGNKPLVVEQQGLYSKHKVDSCYNTNLMFKSGKKKKNTTSMKQKLHAIKMFKVKQSSIWLVGELQKGSDVKLKE